MTKDVFDFETDFFLGTILRTIGRFLRLDNNEKSAQSLSKLYAPDSNCYGVLTTHPNESRLFSLCLKAACKSFGELTGVGVVKASPEAIDSPAGELPGLEQVLERVFGRAAWWRRIGH